MITARLTDFEALHRLRGGAVIAPAEAALFRLSGPGALTCLQGLWTNDVVEPGDATVTYGALLTPKGMIIANGWALRAGETIDLILPAAAREPVAQVDFGVGGQHGLLCGIEEEQAQHVLTVQLADA